jgi:hypothetical protein
MVRLIVILWQCLYVVDPPFLLKLDFSCFLNSWLKV